MTQETAKERIYRETLEKTRDRLDGFEELYANKEVYYAFDELTGLVEKGLSQASKIPVNTDKLSVEKLQEQLNTAKKTLTEIAEIIDDNIHECNYGCDNNCELNGSLDMYSVENVQSVIDSTLAEIGGDDDNY